MNIFIEGIAKIIKQGTCLLTACFYSAQRVTQVYQ